MGGLYAPRTMATVLIGVAACWLNSPARADDPPGFASGFSGSQFVLFLSHPIGAHGVGGTTFGLRYERATLGAFDPAAQWGSPLRHRSLIELQLARGLSPRMQFGPRVTWDLGRRQLGPSKLTTVTWPMATQPLTDATLAAWKP